MPANPVNSSRHYAREFATRAAERGKDESFLVLDAGAGSAPYADLFQHVTYETADLAATEGKDYSHIDYRATPSTSRSRTSGSTWSGARRRWSTAASRSRPCGSSTGS